MTDPDWVDVAALADAPSPGGVARFQLGGRGVLVCNVAGELYAVAARCTHAAWPLDGGPLEGSELVCTLHGARFDVRDGRPRARPASKPLETFAVRIRAERVELAPVGPARVPGSG